MFLFDLAASTPPLRCAALHFSDSKVSTWSRSFNCMCSYLKGNALVTTYYLISPGRHIPHSASLTTTGTLLLLLAILYLPESNVPRQFTPRPLHLLYYHYFLYPALLPPDVNPPFGCYQHVLTESVLSTEICHSLDLPPTPSCHKSLPQTHIGCAGRPHIFALNAETRP